MKKKLIFSILTLSSIMGYTQIDTARLKADTIAVSNKQKQLISFTQELIDGSTIKLSSDSLKGEKQKIEDDLYQLKKDVSRNITQIRAKERALKKTIDELNVVQNKLTDYKSKLNAATNDYEAMKTKIVKLQEDSIKLVLQQDTIKKKSDSITNKTNAVQTEYNRLLIEISKKEDSLEAIAIIKLKNNAIILKGDPKKYKKSEIQNFSLSNFNLDKSAISIIKSDLAKINPGFEADSVKVSKIHLYVKEGRIVEIIVRTDKGIFRNTRSQIDLVHFSERRYSDKLFKDDEDPKDSVRTFIHPGDAITYEPIRSFGDIPYSEFEVTLTPDSTENTYIIRENTSINTYFEVAAFTDINGIAGNANGLAQITGSAKFITSTRNRPNSTLMGLQYISFNGGLSKFDNDFKGTYINVKDSISRKDLFQRSQYSVGVKVNLLRSVRSPYPHLLFNDFQLNTGFNFLGSRIADTLAKSKDTIFRTVTQNQFYVEPIMSFSRQKNFNMTIALPFFYQNLKASSGISNNNWEWWVCPSINLMYYSKRDSKSKIFFRYNHFINLKDKKQAFNQLQLGFAANLTNVMQGK